MDLLTVLSSNRSRTGSEGQRIAFHADTPVQ